MSTILTDVKPSATPSEAEIAAWKALPFDGQLRRLGNELSHPDACVAGDTDMAGVWAKIEARRVGG